VCHWTDDRRTALSVIARRAPRVADHVGPLAQNQQAMVLVWHEYTSAELGLKELDAALATVGEDPHHRTRHLANQVA
jgi:hypothetical protein